MEKLVLLKAHMNFVCFFKLLAVIKGCFQCGNDEGPQDVEEKKTSLSCEINTSIIDIV